MSGLGGIIPYVTQKNFWEKIVLFRGIYNKINSMSKIIRLTENDLVRLVKMVIEEQSSDDDRAKFVVMMESFPKFKFSPNHPMKEFAFIPKNKDIGFSGFGNREFNKFLNKPLIFGLDDKTYCYLDNHNNFVMKHLGKKTTLPLSGNIDKIKSILSRI